MSSWLTIEPVLEPIDEARTLVDELETELSAAYSAEQRHGFDLARLFQPNILFFVARQACQPIGCGGVAFHDGLAELKRMYVRPAARRRGAAQAMLARLEEEASRRGMGRLVLETGDAQHAAIRFYERAGFTRCAAFAPYTTMPPHKIQRSVFFDKRIG